ncbi:MAG: radical SAM family heme chaperone HemW [Clostridia bacterium]|nr:radical SAM family heme chaperone HemW [Clostridia bacterium]
MEKLGLYLHIPFCRSKCAYCDFLSFPNLDRMESYKNKLLLEIAYYADKLKGEYIVDTVFIGGGTPSILPLGYVSEIVDAICKNFTVASEVEITVESNPESLDVDKVSEYQNACNRVSLGVQSLNNKTLKIIGRAHDENQARRALELLTNTNLKVNADLILGLPESEDDCLRSVSGVLDCGVKHLSAYGLGVEKGTKLFDMVKDGVCTLPDGDRVADLYNEVLSLTSRYGLERYEVSNFAHPGYECKHNLGYWTRKSYLGMGLGAHSLLQNARFYNTSSLSDYLNTINFDEIKTLDAKLSKEDELEESVMLGLRLSDGITLSVIKERFGVDILDKYSKGISKLSKVLDVTEEKIRVKKEYFYTLNSIIVEFLD